MSNVIIGRWINGISLNGLKYVLNDDESVMVFESQAIANQFLINHGMNQEEIDNYICFKNAADI